MTHDVAACIHRNYRELPWTTSVPNQVKSTLKYEQMHGKRLTERAGMFLSVYILRNIIIFKFNALSSPRLFFSRHV